MYSSVSSAFDKICERTTTQDEMVKKHMLMCTFVLRHLNPTRAQHNCSTQQLHENAGDVPPCAPDISGDLPPPSASPDDDKYKKFSIPSFKDLGVDKPEKDLKFKGGEREALARLKRVMVRLKILKKSSPCRC